MLVRPFVGWPICHIVHIFNFRKIYWNIYEDRMSYHMTNISAANVQIYLDLFRLPLCLAQSAWL